MTITSVSNIDPPDNFVADKNKITFLDGKIQTLIHKIDQTNRELKEVEKELEVDPYPSSLQKLARLTCCFLTPIHSYIEHEKERKSERMFNLLQKKEALETLRKANHEYLTHYEQQLAKCEKAFKHKYQAFLEKNLQNDKNIDEPSEQKPHRISVIKSSAGISIYQLDPSEKSEKGQALAQLNERARKIFQKAMSFPLIKDLYIEAKQTPHYITKEIGPWIVHLFDDQQQFICPGTVGGCCIPDLRMIEIDGKLSDDEILDTFVFELTNATKTQEINKLFYKAKAGRISREEYAKTAEFLEYLGALRHHNIMEQAIQEMGWDPSLDRYNNLPKTFEEDWNLRKNIDHTEHYRKQWDKIRLLTSDW